MKNSQKLRERPDNKAVFFSEKMTAFFLDFSLHFWLFVIQCGFKVHLFQEGHKILQNLHLTFDYSTYSQKLVENFAKFCVPLRIHELYKKNCT